MVEDGTMRIAYRLVSLLASASVVTVLYLLVLTRGGILRVVGL